MKRTFSTFIILALLAIASPKTYAQVSVGLSITIAPPALPVYVQPVCPGDDYIWTPGYWAYGDDGYYWVPGVWVLAPQPGYLWTPAYWGFEGGFYGFHAGYWGPHIGFYGGINYGFGYGGYGYAGGRWDGGHFRYNTAITHVNTTIIHNTYVDRTVIVNNVNRTSFNGRGGVDVRPRADEQRAMTEHHIQPTTRQVSHQQTASRDRSQFANVNHGQPAVAAMNRVGGTRYNPAGTRAPAPPRTNQRPAVSHPQPVNRPAVHNTPPVQRPAQPRPAQTRPVQPPRPVQQQRPVQPRPLQQPRPVQRPVPQPRQVQPPRPPATHPAPVPVRHR